MGRRLKYFLILVLAIAIPRGLVWADEQIPAQEAGAAAIAVEEISLEEGQILVKADPEDDTLQMDPVRYTLGPEDVVEINIMRHPEFSGVYPINLEGKLQYKFVGDIDVKGLTKKELEDKIAGIISAFVIEPEVNVTILEYKSKVIYILGEVGKPGKFYMKSETIPVREAVVNAGLPTHAAAMRRCRIITPNTSGKGDTKTVDLYEILYAGNLKNNMDMYPGDVLYVPSTVMAKIIRVINPVASTVGIAASGPESISSGKAAVTSLVK